MGYSNEVMIRAQRQLDSDNQRASAEYNRRLEAAYERVPRLKELDNLLRRSMVLAAQAADELLNIVGITASFVLYPDGDTVFVSARSIGSANAQMILEPLGGGGNTATAGAQIQGITVKDALDKLVASIDKFYEQ